MSVSLSKHIARLAFQHGGLRALGRAIKVGAPHLSRIVYGKANASDAVLRKLGLERVVTYRKLS